MATVEKQWPDVISMILADVVHQDGATGKFSILGTYSAIGAMSFPWTHPYMAVYLALTDGRGVTPMKMRLIDADEEEDPLFEEDAVLDFDDPTQVVEIQFFHAAVVFPKPGEYRLQLYGAGEFLRECRVFVVPFERPGMPRENDASDEDQPDES